MSTGQAVSRVLGELAAGRRLAEIAELTALPYSRLRRLKAGTRSVDPSELTALRRIPGFSAKFDSFVGQDSGDLDATLAGNRLLNAFPDGGAESVIYQIEALALTMDAETLAGLLKAYRLATTKTRPEPLPENKSAASGRKLSKNA